MNDDMGLSCYTGYYRRVERFGIQCLIHQIQLEYGAVLRHGYYRRMDQFGIRWCGQGRCLEIL